MSKEDIFVSQRKYTLDLLTETSIRDANLLISLSSSMLNWEILLIKFQLIKKNINA